MGGEAGPRPPPQEKRSDSDTCGEDGGRDRAGEGCRFPSRGREPLVLTYNLTVFTQRRAFLRTISSTKINRLQILYELELIYFSSTFPQQKLIISLSSIHLNTILLA